MTVSNDAHPILIKTALNMLKQKLDDKLISSVTGLSLEEIAKLKQIIDKIEVIEQERLESADLLKDAYNEAKSMGFDVKIIKHVLKLRKMDKNKLEEEDSLIELYRAALQV